MKKILLASTALVLSAVAANAQGLNITGLGRMGVQYNEGAPYAGETTRIESRFQLNFTATVEADHGLTFGAYSRARMQTIGAGTANTGVFSGARVWVESNGLRLTFGNQDGAFASLATGGATVGYTGMSFEGLGGMASAVDTQEFSSTGPSEAPRVSLRYSFGSTTVMLSHDTVQTAGVNETELAIQSAFGATTVAAGISSDDEWFVGANYDGGSWGIGALYYDDNTDENWVISGNVDLGGGSLTAFAGENSTADVYGIGYSYGLGGGASLGMGLERIGGVNAAEIGVVFTF